MQTPAVIEPELLQEFIGQRLLSTPPLQGPCRELSGGTRRMEPGPGGTSRRPRVLPGRGCVETARTHALVPGTAPVRELERQCAACRLPVVGAVSLRRSSLYLQARRGSAHEATPPLRGVARQGMVHPPSMASTIPVTKADPELSRYAAP